MHHVHHPCPPLYCLGNIPPSLQIVALVVSRLTKDYQDMTLRRWKDGYIDQLVLSAATLAALADDGSDTPHYYGPQLKQEMAVKMVL